MRRQVTICCASQVIKSTGKHSKDKLICANCLKPVKKLKPIQSGTWAKAY